MYQASKRIKSQNSARASTFFREGCVAFAKCVRCTVACAMILMTISPLNASEKGSNVQDVYVETISVNEQNDVRVSRSFTGTLVAKRSSELGFKSIGRVQKLFVEQGERVKKGQTLAELDVSSLRADVKVLESEKLVALAKLDELVAGPRKQTIEAARRQADELLAMRDQARSTFERRQRLANSEAISVQDIDDARHQLAAAEAKLKVQQQMVGELEEGTRKEQIAAQRAEVQMLDARIASLGVQLEESRLIAPYDAIVSSRIVDEGAIVSPGASIFRIIELAPLEAWIGIPPELLSEVRSAEKFELTVSGKSRTGRLKSILPELNAETRTQIIVLELNQLESPSVANDVGSLGFTTDMDTVGQIVQLNLSQRVSQPGYWLPVAALTRGVKGLWSVYVVEDPMADDGESSGFTLQRRDVEVVQIDSNRVLVRGTLREGDRVVAAGVQKLTTGQKVLLSPATTANRAEVDLR